MLQKIIQIGNSIGVIIPQSLAKNKLKVGDSVLVEKDETSEIYTVSKNKKTATASITPHFLEVLERVNIHYGSALREIAKR